MPVFGSPPCSSPARELIVCTFWKPACCQSIRWLTNAKKRVSDDKGRWKLIGSLHPGTKTLERIARGHFGAIEIQLLEHRLFAKAMRVHAHHAQQRHAPWQREGENVSSGEARELSLVRAQASPGRLRSGQLRVSFLEHPAALRQQLWILFFPHRQVGAGVDDGESAIANVRFQSTNLRLRNREGDQRDAIGLLQIVLELFESQPRRGAIFDTVFQQLTIVIAYIARRVV